MISSSILRSFALVGISLVGSIALGCAGPTGSDDVGSDEGAITQAEHAERVKSCITTQDKLLARRREGSPASREFDRNQAVSGATACIAQANDGTVARIETNVAEIQSPSAGKVNAQIKAFRDASSAVCSVLGDSGSNVHNAYGSFDKAGKTYEGFSVKYPRDFDEHHGQEANGNLLGTALVKLSFPQDAFPTPKTNFSEAYMTVSVDSGKNAVKTCYDNPDTASADKTLLTVVTVAGIDFRRGDYSGAAAGNRYDSRLYRALRGSRCYEVALTVHTGAIGNYATGSVAEFDKEKAFSVLQKMLGTFQFVDKAPTP